MLELGERRFGVACQPLQPAERVGCQRRGAEALGGQIFVRCCAGFQDSYRRRNKSGPGQIVGEVELGGEIAGQRFGIEPARPPVQRIEGQGGA